MEPLEALLDPKQVAELLGVNRDFVYNRVEDGTLAHIKMGRLLRFRREDVQAFIDAQYRESVA